MDDILFLVLRRMRAPLLLLITAYAIAIGGLVLIPGVDSAGRPWHFDFLHAFYFVTYTASTIGFGEIPYAFSPAQRLWVSGTIYLTVIGWLYAFGTILGLLQDPAFRRAVAHRVFVRRVRRIPHDFYIVCGYGETGEMVVRLLAMHRLGSVVIDSDPEAVTRLGLDEKFGDVPGLTADVHDPAALLRAGLRHYRCQGVIAVTGDDHVNVDVALAAMLLAPQAKIVCATQQDVARVKLPTSHPVILIDPFETFGALLALAIQQPENYRLYNLLSDLPGQRAPPGIQPPRGAWVLCGYGRFGHAVERHLCAQGITTTVIEANPSLSDGHVITGAGTDAATLGAAHIEQATGIVAGTDSDIANLGITLNARELNPRIFTAVRQNLDLNQELFTAAPVNLVMETSRMVVSRIVVELTNPLLREFLSLADRQDARWAAELVDRLCDLTGNTTPDLWRVTLDQAQAPAVVAALAEGQPCVLGDLQRDPKARDSTLPCLALLAVRNGTPTLLPAEDYALARGTRILFASGPGVARRMEWSLGSPRILAYLQFGVDLPDSVVFRWWVRRRTTARPR